MTLPPKLRTWATFCGLLVCAYLSLATSVRCGSTGKTLRTETTVFFAAGEQSKVLEVEVFGDYAFLSSDDFVVFTAPDVEVTAARGLTGQQGGAGGAPHRSSLFCDDTAPPSEFTTDFDVPSAENGCAVHGSPSPRTTRVRVSRIFYERDQAVVIAGEVHASHSCEAQQPDKMGLRMDGVDAVPVRGETD